VNAPVSRRPAAVSDPVDPQKGGGTGADAVEALARILDPDVFDEGRPESLAPHAPYLRARARTNAGRAVLAGYRLVSEEPS
jgi:hypothetical protein